jgi:tryptophanyl-tRNA synthetase
VAQKISLTGIKPTGTPHIGNYLGAIKPALQLANDYRACYFIADYHALTTVRDPKQLKELTYEVAATWLALGLDPENVIFYRQSDVPEIFELNWILACFMPKGALNRAHAYKACVDQNLADGADADAGINTGLFNYPTLMAADILIFKSDVVPVGPDQKQHIEMARDVASSFNHTYSKNIFTPPEPLIQEDVTVVPGIDGRKMSKSYNNQVPLFSTKKQLRKRIMQIVTDSKTVEESKDPDTCNIFAMLKLFATKETLEEVRQKYIQGGTGYGDIKQILFEHVDEHISESRVKYDALMADKKAIDKVLLEGAEKARKIAGSTLQKIRKAIGM